MLFNIGDLVTRKSHNNDIIFKILKIEDRIVYLKGKDIRLYADSYIEDLVISKNELLDKEDELLKVREKITLDRSEYFYLPGKILHIDSDILLSNDLLNPYKIRKKAKIQKYINHQKKQKMSKI